MEPTVDDLVARLRAQLDEDERVALAALETDAHAFPAPEFTVEYEWARITRHPSGGVGSSFAPGAPDPARVLRWVRAAREILDRHQPEDVTVAIGEGRAETAAACLWCSEPVGRSGTHGLVDPPEFVRWPCADVRALATVYGDGDG